jgi:hypothetical protein
VNCHHCNRRIDPEDTHDRKSPKVLITEHCGYYYRWHREPKFPSILRGYRYRIFAFGNRIEMALDPWSRIIDDRSHNSFSALTSDQARTT